MSAVMASPHWQYIWPVYAIAAVTFAALAVWAFASLHSAAKRARAEDAETR